MSKYITFNLIESKPKTKVYSIINIASDCSIGIIKWYGSWHQYCFFPNPDTVFSRGCLNDITEFIEKEMKERKK